MMNADGWTIFPELLREKQPNYGAKIKLLMLPGVCFQILQIH
jgi:hypothetical protein